jgi:spore coat polysaccharide biosynthesis protein SpsF
VLNGERIGIVVQARMHSSRLPGKALIPIEGKPLLYRLCDRVARSQQTKTLVIATSDQPGDQLIENACRSRGIPVFRGPERDLTSRLLGAAYEHDLTVIVRVTGDNPLTDPEGIDELISIFRNEKADLVHNSHRHGYPYGTGAELVRVSALVWCDKELKGDDQRENALAYLRQHPDRFTCLKVSAPSQVLRPQYFLTVDYPEDVELVSRIYAQFHRRDDIKLEKIVEYLDSNAELARLNSHRHRPFSA